VALVPAASMIVGADIQVGKVNTFLVPKDLVDDNVGLPNYNIVFRGASLTTTLT
jgi:hypothetical protein